MLHDLKKNSYFLRVYHSIASKQIGLLNTSPINSKDINDARLTVWRDGNGITIVKRAWYYYLASCFRLPYSLNRKTTVTGPVAIMTGIGIAVVPRPSRDENKNEKIG